jgi:putative inorganic carbon (hco3(-)) transporter
LVKEQKSRNLSFIIKIGSFLPETNLFKKNEMVPILDKVIQFSLVTFVIFSVFSISVTQIAFTLGTLAFLLKTHLTKSWKELRGTWVGIAILCFCLACVSSVITSVDLVSSIKHLKKFLQFIIFFWVANTIQNERLRDLLTRLVILAGVTSSLYGIFPLLDPEFFSEMLYGTKPGGIARPIGTMSTPSTFSGVIMLVGLFALGNFLFRKPTKYWTFGSTGIIGLALLFALTRQAWLGFLMGSLFLLFFWNKKYLMAIPALLVVILLFAPDTVTSRIQSLSNMKDNAFNQRLTIWKSALDIFKDHPITGCGFKCVDLIHSQYPDPSGFVSHFRGVHSNIFQLLVDTGILGLGFWISIWVAYFIEVYKRLRILDEKADQHSTKGILMGSCAAVIGFLIGGVFETTFYDSEVAMLLYFLMGLSLAQTKKTLGSSQF